MTGWAQTDNATSLQYICTSSYYKDSNFSSLICRYPLVAGVEAWLEFPCLVIESVSEVSGRDKMVAYLVTGLSVSQVLEQGDDTQPEIEGNA